MDQDRWKTVNRIFHAALDVSTSERGEFISKASAGDLSIAEEVNQLLQADLDAGSYMESPVAPGRFFHSAIAGSPLALNPGDVLCGRFHILRLVGEGGMGHVFEALDEELGVHVALKIIRPEIASNLEALARFRQEVRLARRITHPNVCRTFDIERETRVVDEQRGVTTDFVFLTMEFLEGQTLAEKVAQDGPLTLDLAGNLARQVADALEAAHALGVIHRDIKPANIMLVPATAYAHGFRAVITDFGLARSERIDSLGSLPGISNRTNPIGSLAYMAPEQIAGAQISTATDVYAFGLLLFEIATGKRAFPSDTLLNGIAQRLEGPPPDPTPFRPDLPATWHQAISKCLQVKPEDRLPTVGTVIATLEGQEDDSVSDRTDRHNGFRKWLSFRRTINAFAVLIAGVSLFWSGLRFSRLEKGSNVRPGALVYLAPVKNHTSEKALDNMTELVQAGLEQSARIDLLDEGRVGDTLQRMTKAPDAVIDESTAREIAMRNGAVRVVFANVSGAEGKYRLDVDVQQPDNTPARYRDHWKRSFTWQSAPSSNSPAIPQDLLVAVRTASNWIRLEAGESANDIARLDVPPEDVTTDNWEALADLAEAEKLQEAQQTSKAIVALQEAVALDPHFSLAQGRLGDLLFAAGAFQDGYLAYQRALDSGESRRLSRKEHDRISGELAIDTWDYASAERAYRDLTIYYESDYTGWAFRGFPLVMLGRTDEAIQSLERAYNVNPGRYTAPWELARANIVLGHLPEALSWAKVLADLGSPETCSYIQGAVQFLRHDYKNAAASFAAMGSSQRIVIRSWSYLLQARVAAETGNMPGALTSLNQGIEFDRQNGVPAMQADKYLARAYIHSLTTSPTQCLQDVRAALKIDSSPQRIIVASSILGDALSRTSHWKARDIMAELKIVEERIPPTGTGAVFELARLRVRGEILLANGNIDEALAKFRNASQLDAETNPRDYLGRALVIAARVSRDQRVARQLHQEAFDAFGSLALYPGRLWLDSLSLLPGAYASQLRAIIELAPLIPEMHEQGVRAREELSILHSGSVPTSW